MRVILTTALVIHGIAHLPGFLAAWRIAELDDLPYRTTLFAGLVDIGSIGTRVIGSMWLLAALGFFAAAVGVGNQLAWAPRAVAGLVATSLLLCLSGWPEARVGAVVNVVVAALAVYVLRVL